MAQLGKLGNHSFRLNRHMVCQCVKLRVDSHLQLSDLLEVRFLVVDNDNNVAFDQPVENSLSLLPLPCLLYCYMYITFAVKAC
jgi:hypothetical protein